MREAPKEPLSYATPTARPVLRPGLRIGIGFVVLALDVVAAFWFSNNNHRIGPEWSEPAVVLIGWLIIALIAGIAFVELVRGIKALPPGPG